MPRLIFCRFGFALLIVLGAAGALAAAVPAEVQVLRFASDETIAWDSDPAADHYNVYLSTIDDLRDGSSGRCHAYRLSGTQFTTPTEVAPGEIFFFLVTAESSIDGEGTAGFRSGTVERVVRGACAPVMRNHLLDRVGFGGDPWSRDRLAALAAAGYIDEQLAPDSIVENPELVSRIAAYEPPTDIFDLMARQVVAAVYARRQLEWQMAGFWSNHFNTFWGKVVNFFVAYHPPCATPGVPAQCDPAFPAKAYELASDAQWREMSSFRDLTFEGGSFRDLLEASAMSPAMMIYLDTYTSIVGNPNENFPRELMELYALGVNAGYTQQDVEELSRVFTGWTICKKTLADADDPLAPCVDEYWLETPAGRWVPHFSPALHDCTQKTLFEPPVVISDTCAQPLDGLQDVGLALDALATHPATAPFITGKLLSAFVTDDPDQETIDDLVAVWNDGANPAGVGDLHAVLSATLHHPSFLGPDRVGGKIKTPLEHFASAIRAVGGHTNGYDFVLGFLVNAQHMPHYNPVPTGFAEVGDAWIDTNNTLERQNFGLALALLDEPTFGSDPVALLNAGGVSTAPGNTEQIVDFLADLMFGGGLNPAERQSAIDYLDRDVNGTPAPYDAARIRELVGYLLAFPQFQEQ